MTRRFVVPAALVILTVLGTTGCSTHPHSQVEYRVESSFGAVGSVAYYVLEGPGGGVILTEDATSSTWTKKVGGGSNPQVTATAPAHGTARCTITDKSGTTLAEATVADGGRLTCRYDRASSN